MTAEEKLKQIEEFVDKHTHNAVIIMWNKTTSSLFLCCNCGQILTVQKEKW